MSLLAEYLEKWEKDDRAKLVIVKVCSSTFGSFRLPFILLIDSFQLIWFQINCYLVIKLILDFLFPLIAYSL